MVYGLCAALTVAPIIRDTGGALGMDVSTESALAAGLRGCPIGTAYFHLGDLIEIGPMEQISKNWYDYEVDDEPPENPAGRDHAPECTGFLSTSLVVESA